MSNQSPQSLPTDGRPEGPPNSRYSPIGSSMFLTPTSVQGVPPERSFASPYSPPYPSSRPNPGQSYAESGSSAMRWPASTYTSEFGNATSGGQQFESQPTAQSYPSHGSSTSRSYATPPQQYLPAVNPSIGPNYGDTSGAGGAYRGTLGATGSSTSSYTYEAPPSATEGPTYPPLVVPSASERSSRGPPPKNHICPTCAKGFGRPSALAQHELTHSGERPFVCPHCPKTFNTSSNRKRHQALHEQAPKPK